MHTERYYYYCNTTTNVYKHVLYMCILFYGLCASLNYRIQKNLDLQRESKSARERERAREKERDRETTNTACYNHFCTVLYSKISLLCVFRCKFTNNISLITSINGIYAFKNMIDFEMVHLYMERNFNNLFFAVAVFDVFFNRK